MGTAGNLSAKEDTQSFWITASGQSKGSLCEQQFLQIGLDGTIIKQEEQYKDKEEDTEDEEEEEDEEGAEEEEEEEEKEEEGE